MKLLIDQGYPDIVDECHLWVNTTDFDDLQWIKACTRMSAHQWVKLINLPAGVVIDPKNLWWTVSKFYRFAKDPNTIYIKIDDDVVLLDSLRQFKNFLDFRIDNPRYFLVSANVLNNSICTYMMQSFGLLSTENSGLQSISCDSHDKIGMSGNFAEALHDFVIENEFDLDKFHFSGSCGVANHARVCINCIVWFGEDMASLEEIPKDDEVFLSTTVPSRWNREVCIFGEYTVCHFGYGTQQRHLMENTDLLDKYHRNAFAGTGDWDASIRREKFRPGEISMR